MAELVIDAVIQKTVDILGNLLVDEAAQSYWTEEDIEWIETELRRMQSFLRDLDATQSASDGVANLVRDVRILAYHVEDIIDSYIPNVATQNKNFLHWVTKRLNCFPCGSHQQFVMEIAGIKKRVEDINRSRTTYGINENTASRVTEVEEWNPRQSYPHVEVPVVIGFQEHIKALETRILDAGLLFSVTSIIGMPGVGKTTLAKNVYNSLRKAKLFQCSAWVYVSQEPKLKDLLQDIAKQVGLVKERREENLEANLFNFLRKKSYVIVIDDIWDIKAWNFLRNGIPSNCEKRSRLILTSRNRDVGLFVGGSSSLHELQPLNAEMSWQLFSLFVKIPIQESTDHDELMHLGKQILKRCGGLPLAITTIAGLLSTKGVTEHAWRGVLNKMVPEKNEVLALSYRDLPTVVKPCFLYFGLFPRDRIIPVRELINLWVAEGFIQSQGTQTLEEASEDCLNELISRNLIQVEKINYDGRVKSCRIHDVLRDLCISLAQEEDFFKIQSGNDSVNRTMESRRAAFFHQKNIDNNTSLNRQFPKLRTILYFKEQDEIPPTILVKNTTIQESFRLLRVLRFEGLERGQRLPDGIGNLVHIRYLHLCGEDLVLPITMGNLKNLEVLDCANCPGLILPTVVWKLEKLRHVFIDFTTTFKHASKFSHMRRQFQEVEQVSLPNLQTLCNLKLNAALLKADSFRKLTRLTKLGIYGTVKQLTDILTHTTHLSGTLEKFRWVSSDFGSSSSSQEEGLPALNFSGYHNLRVLVLWGLLPKKLSRFSRNLTKLTLKDSVLEKDSMMELGRLPKLRVLKLHGNSHLGHVMVISGPDSFSSLEKLEIEKNLKVLKIEDDGEDRVMPNLRHVLAGGIRTLDVRSNRLKLLFKRNPWRTHMRIIENPAGSLANSYDELGEESCPPKAPNTSWQVRRFQRLMSPLRFSLMFISTISFRRNWRTVQVEEC